MPAAREDPRRRFAELVRGPEAEIDLAEAALWLAAEEYPALDPGAYLERLDALAAAARPGLRGAASDRERALRLGHFLFVESGFRGNREAYDDPRNSFLNEVLERGTGIPITLSLVYMEVGRRLDLAVEGVGFPGHFLVRCPTAGELLLDAFFGRPVGLPECRERLRALLGEEAELLPERHLRAATPREILVRMLTNLKHLYLRGGDPGRALGCCDRILLLTPEAALELRDRGLVYQRLECFAAALADLTRFLELAPGDESAPAVAARVEALRRAAPPLH